MVHVCHVSVNNVYLLTFFSVCFAGCSINSFPFSMFSSEFISKKGNITRTPIELRFPNFYTQYSVIDLARAVIIDLDACHPCSR